MATAPTYRHFDATFTDRVQELYADYRVSLHKPALDRLRDALTDLVKTNFNPTDRVRIRVEAGRIKQLDRLLKKASAETYRRTIKKPEHVFEKIHDIVGIRITCNVASDVRRVADAILSLEKESRRKKKTPSCRVFKDHEPKDYIAVPRDTGYRAYHIFLEIDVPHEGRLRAVVCEVQIRTLLQHAWGELTHEDTYKPGMAIPGMVTKLSKRLATALAVLDEIAQDIRDELDQFASLPENEDAAGSGEPPVLREVGSGRAFLPTGQEKAQLSARYPEGSTHTGDVIFSGWDYALIQLPYGHKGILHWKQVSAKPGTAFIDVRDYANLGDSVVVRVTKVDDASNRIELALPA